MQFYFSGSFYSSLPTMKWGFLSSWANWPQWLWVSENRVWRHKPHCFSGDTVVQLAHERKTWMLRHLSTSLCYCFWLCLCDPRGSLYVQSNALLNIVEWIRWICLGCVWKRVTCPFLGEEADFEAVIKFFLWYNFTLTKISILRSCSRSRMYNLSCDWLVWSTLRVWVDNSYKKGSKPFH